MMSQKSRPLFGTVSEIAVEDPSSWEERFFLTLDVDWAPDYVIREVDQMLRSLDVAATWFITHESEAIDELRRHDRYEIGVHPNFVPVLMGRPGAASAHEVVEYVRRIAPEARSFRCHSLVQASPLLEMMQNAGFSIDCNSFLPYTPIASLAPWAHGNGLVRVPYCWEDDTWVLGWCRDTADVVTGRGLKVIDVHPIHLWLNSESLERYSRVKENMSDESRLRSVRNTRHPGVEDAVRSMIDGIKNQAKE